MNYFFGINNSELSCKLTIPKFQNQSIPQNKYKLYMAKIENCPAKPAGKPTGKIL